MHVFAGLDYDCWVHRFCEEMSEKYSEENAAPHEAKIPSLEKVRAAPTQRGMVILMGRIVQILGEA